MQQWNWLEMDDVYSQLKHISKNVFCLYLANWNLLRSFHLSIRIIVWLLWSVPAWLCHYPSWPFGRTSVLMLDTFFNLHFRRHTDIGKDSITIFKPYKVASSTYPTNGGSYIIFILSWLDFPDCVNCHLICQHGMKRLVWSFRRLFNDGVSFFLLKTPISSTIYIWTVRSISMLHWTYKKICYRSFW